MVALRATAMARAPRRLETFPDVEVPAVHAELLNLVNAERTAAGLATLKADSLASRIAQKHAAEMAEHSFLSHWGLDGRKPYHRYSFAGGVEAIRENCAAMSYNLPISSEYAVLDLIELHKLMHDEVPPDDGHRKTILSPSQTHVGFGFAYRGFNVRLCELYVARYLTINPYPATARPRSKFTLSGQLFDPTSSLPAVDVYYEPLPSPPDIAWLRIPRPYGLPDERATLFPKLPQDYYYKDGSKGSIQVSDRGRFRVPIKLRRKEPGIYTIVVWIQQSPTTEPFPATEVCVRAE